MSRYEMMSSSSLNALFTVGPSYFTVTSATFAPLPLLANTSGVPGSEQAICGCVWVHERAGPESTILGHPLVARLRRDEGEDPLRDGSGCFRVSLPRRASVLGCRRQQAHSGLCDAPYSRPVGGNHVLAS